VPRLPRPRARMPCEHLFSPEQQVATLPVWLTRCALGMQAFILQVPQAHALSQGAAPEASTPFVKQLSARLRAAALDEDAQSVQSRSRFAA